VTKEVTPAVTSNPEPRNYAKNYFSRSIRQMKDREEEQRKKYDQLLEEMNRATTVEQYKNLAEQFMGVPFMVNAQFLAHECRIKYYQLLNSQAKSQNKTKKE